MKRHTLNSIKFTKEEDGTKCTLLPPTRDNLTNLKEAMRNDVEDLNEIIDYINEDILPAFAEDLADGTRSEKGMKSEDHWWLDDDKLSFRVKKEGDNYRLCLSAWNGHYIDYCFSRKFKKAARELLKKNAA